MKSQHLQGISFCLSYLILQYVDPVSTYLSVKLSDNPKDGSYLFFPSHLLTEFNGKARGELHLHKLPEFIKVLEGAITSRTFNNLRQKKTNK